MPKIIVKIPVMPTGKTTDMSGREFDFAPEQLAAIAQNYSTDKYAAKIQSTHDDSTSNEGEIVGAETDAAGRLVVLANLGAWAYNEIANNFAEWSVGFFMPGDRNNPTPGELYINHLAIVQRGAAKNLGGSIEGEAEFSEFQCFSNECEGFMSKEKDVAPAATDQKNADTEQAQALFSEADVKKLLAAEVAKELAKASDVHDKVSAFAESVSDKMTKESAAAASKLYRKALASESGLASFSDGEPISAQFAAFIDSLPKIDGAMFQQMTYTHDSEQPETDPFILALRGE